MWQFAYDFLSLGTVTHNEKTVASYAAPLIRLSEIQQLEFRMDAISAKCGHVKRRVLRNERLTGKVLEFAVGVLGEGNPMAVKLIAGEPLTDYEQHILVDVVLLHVRLSPR